MRTYVQDTARRWVQFQASHAAAAEQLRGLVLSVCGDMSGNDRRRQIESMKASAEFRRLRDITGANREALGIRDDSERELALWIRTICFCDVMKD